MYFFYKVWSNGETGFLKYKIGPKRTVLKVMKYKLEPKRMVLKVVKYKLEPKRMVLKVVKYKLEPKRMVLIVKLLISVMLKKNITLV